MWSSDAIFVKRALLSLLFLLSAIFVEYSLLSQLFLSCGLLDLLFLSSVVFWVCYFCQVWFSGSVIFVYITVELQWLEQKCVLNMVSSSRIGVIP